MSFQVGVSGLNAAGRNLDVIGNNVANSNTVGFKGASITESASNPEYTITTTTLSAAPVIMSTVGTLAVASISFVNGTWARDIV